MRLRISELRSIIANLIQEDDESELSPVDKKLQGWAVRSKNSLEAALAKLGIIPVPRGDKLDAMIGEGGHNYVFEVTYKGRRAAARLSTSKGELDSMLKFLSYKDKVSPEHRKHFPELYRTFEVEVQGTFEPETYYGVVVELLEPLNPSLAHDLKFVQPASGKLSRARIMRALEPAMHADFIENFSYRTAALVKMLLHKVIFPLLQNSVGQTPVGVERAIQKKLLSAPTPPDFTPEDFDNIIDKIAGHVRKVLVQEVIPMADEAGSDDRKVKTHPHKKVHEFYDFLRLLADRFGYHWDDMHTKNFMVRPGTGDFVVVDPGLFYEYE